MAGFVYFSIGILLRRFGVPCMILARKWMVWFLIAIVVIGVGRGLVFVGHRALGDCCWVLGIPFLLLSVWGLLPAKPWPQWLVSSAFPVYLLHLFNVQVVELMFSPYTVDWWVYPLRMVVVLAVSLFEVSLIRRHAPTAKFLFGGR